MCKTSQTQYAVDSLLSCMLCGGGGVTACMSYGGEGTSRKIHIGRTHRNARVAFYYVSTLGATGVYVLVK